MSCTITLTKTKTATATTEPEVKPTSTASSLLSRAADIVPEVAAATGLDIGITFFTPFSQYSDALSTASKHEKSWAASQLTEEWKQSGLGKVVGGSVPRALNSWASMSGSSQSDGVRDEVKEALSKARDAMSCFKGASIDDESLKARISDLLDDACSLALSDEESDPPAHSEEEESFILEQRQRHLSPYTNQRGSEL
ncbi:hypothetical protein L202_06820 [Cryptococcus amylolentus CBS 6039]|uniref:Uncharacterized protein n=2 Tax=Cryptococcus amylolentus TaxID=104669 RepID=A0A1E3HDJ3_9TREE|nr:hypothetical protein L202_06820 [Cryptococcus amylolentus CBS 6039]ODN74423.1 hypothetical protein L202_06820 [Cryptococcus amylolentus CBS 6039]ODO01427.1 hypothetical protein I350_06246 [Cryptococcus amylolentus CBS 6273]